MKGPKTVVGDVMSLQLVLKENMSGWIAFNPDLGLPAGRHSFVLSVDAATPELFRFGAIRHCSGCVELGAFHESVPVRGELVLQPTGPSYELYFTLEGIGELHVSGRKTYDVRRLITSMTTLPLVVYRNGQIIGEAELVYRDAILTFPVKSLRLRFGSGSRK
jgi:hypothetical protein